MNLKQAREYLNRFDFQPLFVEELGWSVPPAGHSTTFCIKGIQCIRQPIAELSGVIVFQVTQEDGSMPDSQIRNDICKETSKFYYENVMIFTDTNLTQSVWCWEKKTLGKRLLRTHIYTRGQSGDLILNKLTTLAFGFDDFDEEGSIPLLNVTDRLKQALDIEKVTKKFYGEFQTHHLEFLSLIEGIEDEGDRRWYASVLLNRLMFIYFLQEKFLLDGGDNRYLQNKLASYHEKDEKPDSYYSEFLKALFFEGFAKPAKERNPSTNRLIGKICYLNGGLFLKHPIEQRWEGKIRIPDVAFKNLLSLFESYTWNLNDTLDGDDNEINPDVLGYIFEKYINQKAFGAYYTRPEITEYLCEQTIHRLVLDGVAKSTPGGAAREFSTFGDLLLALDAPLCRKLLFDVLPTLKLLDPACGSAAFLVSAMKTLINIYAAIIGKIEFLNNRKLTEWFNGIKRDHKSIAYYIKREIITNNLFGVDIMEEAVEIAKLRLFLALVASAGNDVDALEPLPNIEFNIMTGNSLIGLLHVDNQEFDLRHPPDLFCKSYGEILAEKNELIELYRGAAGRGASELQEMRDQIQERKNRAIPTLNEILLREFAAQGIRFEQAIIKDKNNYAGSNKKVKIEYKKRALSQTDIDTLKPFHWGYEFDQVLQDGGFDAIITNPPWEIFKPNAKEFFESYSEIVSKKKMTIKDFEKEQTNLLQDEDIASAWLEYLSQYPHVSAYFRSAPQYENQISYANGRKVGSDINLYKLFTEQCFRLLKKGGYCGIVIPSGIYTDLGTKQLRKMLFENSAVSGLFCFENRKTIFEGVDSRFKFVILSYRKGESTSSFSAAFMRHDVAELESFPQQNAIDVDLAVIERLSPDSLSIMEFKSELDVTIAKKMACFPLLGESIKGTWNFALGNEFHMTNSSYLFETAPSKSSLPLYEGKMIWQFDSNYSDPRYWVDETAGRFALLGRREDDDQIMGYEGYRLGHRSIAASTNERTMIATILPPRTFFGHSINATKDGMTNSELVFLMAILNSFICDFSLRSSVSQNLTMFFIYQIPAPRLSAKDKKFKLIVERAARLICTAPEFNDLAYGIFGAPHSKVVKATIKQSKKSNTLNDLVAETDVFKESMVVAEQCTDYDFWRSVSVTDPTSRLILRAELDALVAGLYDLSEEEFAYILSTFPLVDESVKQLTINTYRDYLRTGCLPET